LIPKEKIKYSRQRVNVYHNYFRRSGIYRFVGRTLLKLVFILLSIVIAFYFIEKYLIDFDSIFKYLFEELNTYFVFIVFYLSESILGLIPPDLFIAWSKHSPYPYLAVSILSILSYLGGVTSYYIGKYIGKIPRIKKYVEKKYEKNFQLVNKYGGFVIVFAALFPLPFSPITMVAGIMRYPYFKFLFLALFRFLRIFGYAIFIFWGLNKF
jgi:membrane protein YqaA with SNARE-associated domain